MKQIKTVIWLVAIICIIVMARSYTFAGYCSKCKHGDDTCPPGWNGGGTCWWGGGAFCLGNGSCPVADGIPPPVITDGACNPTSNPNDFCQTKTITVWTSTCSVTCRIRPFISCDCITTGGRTGNLYSYSHVDC